MIDNTTIFYRKLENTIIDLSFAEMFCYFFGFSMESISLGDGKEIFSIKR